MDYALHAAAAKRGIECSEGGSSSQMLREKSCRCQFPHHDVKRACLNPARPDAPLDRAGRRTDAVSFEDIEAVRRHPTAVAACIFVKKVWWCSVFWQCSRAVRGQGSGGDILHGLNGEDGIPKA
jgi:hypothetical protein